MANNAGRGTPRGVVHEKIRGACLLGLVADNPYKTLVPANRAWLPAERTEVRMTVFMKEAATAGVVCQRRMQPGWMVDLLEPASWKTIVNGEVVVLLSDKLG